MSYRVGDRAGKYIPFRVTIPGVDANAVTLIRLRVVREDLSSAIWKLTDLEAVDASTLTGRRILALDGSDLTIPGAYLCRAFCFGAGSVYLYDSEVDSFEVLPARVDWVDA